MGHDQPVTADLSLLGYPFDQYQRYQDVRCVIDTIQSHQNGRPLTILDVGGSTLTTKFLSGYAIVSANLEAGEDIQLQCDGARLPFQDGSYDITIAVDTLEHVPEAQRTLFIHELVRVAGVYTIITGPFSNGYNEAAEAVLNDFLVNVVGVQHRFLAEHIQNGLPDLNTCLRVLAGMCEAYTTIPSGYIHHWLPLMVIKNSLMRLSSGHTLSEELDRFYNYACYWHEHRLPSYRQVIVTSKRKSDVDTLASIQRAFDRALESPIPDLNGVIATWQALRWTQILKERDGEISSLREENRRLSALISAYASGRFVRFMAAVKQLAGLVRKA